MADNKWHLVSTFDRTQTLEEFCNSIDFTIDTNEKYIYRIRDGIKASEQVKKENWYRVKEIDLTDTNDSQKFLERFTNLDSNDVSFVGPAKVYVDGQERDGELYSIEKFPNVIVNENGDIHVVEKLLLGQAYMKVTKVYQEEEWNATNNSWDIVGGEYFLRNNTAYWMYGEKENSTNVWGVTGSGEMKWEKILLNIQSGAGNRRKENDFQLTIYGGTRGFRSFNGTFTSKEVIIPDPGRPLFYDLFVNPLNINTVILNDNSFRDEFEYAKNDDGKVKVSFPVVTSAPTDFSQIESTENETADEFFTRIFEQMILYKNETLPEVVIGWDYPQRSGLFKYNPCSKGLPFTIIFNKEGLESASNGYNINIW